MKLYIVRHGETIENHQRICQGQTHGTLTALGKEQISHLRRSLSSIHFECIYSSDLRRAYQSAEIILNVLDFKPPLLYDQRLRERYFGSFEGQRFPVDYDTFSPPPETESPEKIAIRLDSFLRMLSSTYPNNSNILIVSHGFTIKVLIALLDGKSPESLESLDDISNASLTIVNYEGNRSQIELFNDTSHIE